MSKKADKLKHKAITTVNKVKDSIKKTIYDTTDVPSTSVQKLADFIKNHPETEVTRKDLLNNSYAFYNLNVNNDNYYLETKNSHILQFDAQIEGKQLVAYRSYRDFYNINTPIQVPKEYLEQN